MTDFGLLAAPGNLGFYQSCEVTELFLCRKSDGAILNFYTLAVFEERPFGKRNDEKLGRFTINKDVSLCGIRYRISVEEAEKKFDRLAGENKWSANDKTFSQLPPLKALPKQFVPGAAGSRLNGALKNNFHGGSYVLEFFDEEKPEVAFLLKPELVTALNGWCGQLAGKASIDLSTIRDRLGNILFQFPVTLADVQLKAAPGWDGVRATVAWHPLVTTPPTSFFSVDAILDKNFMGSTIEACHPGPEQLVAVGNIEKTAHVKLWRSDVGLLLFSSSGTYLKGIHIIMNAGGSHPRTFELDGEVVTIDIFIRATPPRKAAARQYTQVIDSNLYDIDKRRLEKELSFKQYNRVGATAIEDLRNLIRMKGAAGVYLWDPFLSAKDLLSTLFYNPQGNVEMRAIGSVNDTVLKVYRKRGKSPRKIMADYAATLNHPASNNAHLRLEFRLQYRTNGWAFHDRFLIFPGEGLVPPQVYSLGTSVNSFGRDHHILQEVSHPQPVIDAFNELWEKLNQPKCIVWKFPSK